MESKHMRLDMKQTRCSELNLPDWTMRTCQRGFLKVRQYIGGMRGGQLKKRTRDSNLNMANSPMTSIPIFSKELEKPKAALVSALRKSSPTQD